MKLFIRLCSYLSIFPCHSKHFRKRVLSVHRLSFLISPLVSSPRLDRRLLTPLGLMLKSAWRAHYVFSDVSIQRSSFPSWNTDLSGYHHLPHPCNWLLLRRPPPPRCQCRNPQSSTLATLRSVYNGIYLWNTNTTRGMKTPECRRMSRTQVSPI